MWPRPVRAILRGLDHSAIYVLIAASYTPPCLLILPSPYGGGLLVFVWTAAALGLVKSFVWPNAPRWLNTVVYVLFGWAILPFAPALMHGLGILSSSLIAGGGALYTLGAVIYGRRWPDPQPTVFGYHELFHIFVIAAAGCQYVAMWRLVT